MSKQPICMHGQASTTISVGEAAYKYFDEVSQITSLPNEYYRKWLALRGQLDERIEGITDVAATLMTHAIYNKPAFERKHTRYRCLRKRIIKAARVYETTLLLTNDAEVALHALARSMKWKVGEPCPF